MLKQPREMVTMWQILKILSERNIYFCFQSQSSGFYNLMVTDSHGRQHNIHSTEIDRIEEGLKIVWGHLLNTKHTNASLPLPPRQPLPLPGR